MSMALFTFSHHSSASNWPTAYTYFHCLFTLGLFGFQVRQLTYLFERLRSWLSCQFNSSLFVLIFHVVTRG